MAQERSISIFCRIRPLLKGKSYCHYEIDEDGDGKQRLNLHVPKDGSEIANHKREQFRFRFDGVFDLSSVQAEVFEAVAQPAVDNVINGYNATIFAYGQTGSGKTFTVTGGPERFEDRGLIPRSLERIFNHAERHAEREFTVAVSYLEIYNEVGYDLLDSRDDSSKPSNQPIGRLEDLPKVTLFEDSDANIHVKNLSMHVANNVEEALNLLFVGDTNRMVAETPMNQASTRSHCIFTIHITSKEVGNATIRRAKLHLVDLAGSERVSKTGINGQLLTEAKYINLSLHYLEQVIIALGERNRQHIPYRNSMMTSVLRDSLGGNCLTTMIATCSVEPRNVLESISTCRFAQRVALVRNEALVNEELDPHLVITRLRSEIATLRSEVALLRSGDAPLTDEPLSEADLARLDRAIREYIDDRDDSSTFTFPAGDVRKFNEAFRIFRRLVRSSRSSAPPVTMPVAARGPAPVKSQPAAAANAITKLESVRSSLADSDANNHAVTINLENPIFSKTVEDLHETIRQRDNEIKILVGMLKKEKKRAEEALAALGSTETRKVEVATTVRKANDGVAGAIGRDSSRNRKRQEDLPTVVRNKSEISASTAFDDDAEIERRKPMSSRQPAKQIVDRLSIGKQEAFEIFRRDHADASAIEQRKAMLKERYREAKSLGERLNNLKQSIARLKVDIERSRLTSDDSQRNSMSSRNAASTLDESSLRERFETEKRGYKETFERLRALKAEIEYQQNLLEKAKVTLIKQFESWWEAQCAELNESQSSNSGRRVSGRQADLASVSFTSTASIADRPVSGRVQAKPANNNSYLLQGAQPAGPVRDAIRSSASIASNASSNIPLTGDPETDAEIAAFVRARQAILSRTHTRPT